MVESVNCRGNNTFVCKLDAERFLVPNLWAMVADYRSSCTNLEDLVRMIEFSRK